MQDDSSGQQVRRSGRESTKKVPGTHSEASQLREQHNNEVRRTINEARAGRGEQWPAADAHSLRCRNAQMGPQHSGNEPSRCSDLTGCGAHTEGKALDEGAVVPAEERSQ